MLQLDRKISFKEVEAQISTVFRIKFVLVVNWIKKRGMNGLSKD
jgi:hypothetical protein